eukprot:6190997-Pleurochrysis_carterae.AAC.5
MATLNYNFLRALSRQSERTANSNFQPSRTANLTPNPVRTANARHIAPTYNDVRCCSYLQVCAIHFGATAAVEHLYLSYE